MKYQNRLVGVILFLILIGSWIYFTVNRTPEQGDALYVFVSLVLLVPAFVSLAILWGMKEHNGPTNSN